MSKGTNGVEDALEPRNLMIPRSQWDELRRLSYEEDRSISEIVREALDGYLNPTRTA